MIDGANPNPNPNLKEKTMNTTPRVIILRGLPGSGKSTLARSYRDTYAGVAVCSADAFPGLYNADGSINFALLGDAHDWCFAKFSDACEDAASDAGFDKPTLIIVDNTNTTLAEMSPYRMVARMYHLPVEFVTADSGCTPAELAERTTHGVPEQAITGMGERWETAPPFWETETTIATGGQDQ